MAVLQTGMTFNASARICWISSGYDFWGSELGGNLASHFSPADQLTHGN